MILTVWTNDTAWNGSKVSYKGAKSIDHRSIPAVLRRIFGVGLDDLRVRWLQVLATRRFDLNDGVGINSGCFAVAVDAGLRASVHVGWWRWNVVCLFVMMMMMTLK